jgi:porin
VKRLTFPIAISSFVVFVLAAKVGAQAPTPNYSGDLWSRPALTGDWGGLRNQMAEKGVTFDVNFHSFFQGIVDGGRDKTWRWSGANEMVLNLDSQKLGLWPGGFLMMRGEAAYNHPVNPFTGAIMPVNTKPVLPLPARNEFVLSHLVFTQFLAEWFGVSLGKLDTSGGDMNEFAHVKNEQFMNLAFSATPMAMRTTPYSTLGMALIFLPTKKAEDAIVSFSVVDSEGITTRGGFDTLFKDGTTLAAEGRLTIRPFGLTGHQLLGLVWSNKKFNSLEQDPRTLIGNILLGTPLQTEDGSWAVYYNFDQYLYNKPGAPSEGIGIFGRIGISDGKANPFQQFYSFGFGGKGMIPTRGKDQWGFGYYFLKLSDELPRFLRNRLGLDHEQGGEIYYNIAVTPWLHFTPDLQIIAPARKDTDTTFVLGFRMKVDF